MIDPVDARFFRAAQEVLSETGAEGTGPCRAAVDRALETGAPLDLRAARAHLDALAPPIRDTVMAQVHACMARDLSAIWDLMPHAPGTRTPN